MIRLICVPYHLGRHRVGMGDGPSRLLAAGAAQELTLLGERVAVSEVVLPVPFEHEIGAHFALQRAVAEHVGQAVADNELPYVLGGNCSCVLGAVAGLGRGARIGVVWFDAHADANTPDTTASGFLDGMPVAVLTGRCWQGLAAAVPGFAPLPDDQVVLAGTRSVDRQEQVLLDSSGLTLVPPAKLSAEPGVGPAVSGLAERVDSVHLHVDLDVIDTRDGHANEFAVDGGPSLAALDAAIRTVGAQIAVSSVSLTSYNPTVDIDGRALGSAMRLLTTLGETALR